MRIVRSKYLHLNHDVRETERKKGGQLGFEPRIPCIQDEPKASILPLDH